MFRGSRLAAALLVFSSSITFAQSLCPAGVKSDKLICLIPQVFGVSGFVLPAGPSQFQNSFAGNSLVPLNSALGRQSVILPVASPSSGILFAWDPVAKLPVLVTDSFGPIYGERANTIGAHQVFLGVSYQNFQFTSLDGTELKHLPEVFTQPDFVGSGLDCSLNDPARSVGACAFIRDVIRVESRVDLKIHQFTMYATVGLADRIDLSVIVPVENLQMGITSTATIVDNSKTGFHAFSCGTPPVDCLTNTFFNTGRASGVGDMILRVKAMAWKGNKAGLAMGLDYRLATGDSLNFLGAGAAGIRPFLAWSLTSRFSPHVDAGFEANGSSRIAGDITAGTKERLPSQLTYVAGADVWLNKRVTLAADLVGQQIFQGKRLSSSTFIEPGACSQTFPQCAPPFAPANRDSNLTQSVDSFSVTNIAIGMKIRAVSNLLLTGNVLIKASSSGLRAKAVPMIEISYTFPR